MEQALDTVWQQMSALPARPAYIAVDGEMHRLVSEIIDDQKRLDAVTTRQGLRAMFPGIGVA